MKAKTKLNHSNEIITIRNDKARVDRLSSDCLLTFSRARCTFSSHVIQLLVGLLGAFLYFSSSAHAQYRLDGSGFSSLLSGSVYDVVTQSDGKLIVVGDFSSINQINDIVRLNVDGSIDASFNTNGGTGGVGEIYSVDVDAQGQIVIGGSFQSMGGESRLNVALLSGDGDVLPFRPEASGPNQAVLAVKAVGNDRYLIGGAFSELNGVASSGLARISVDGTTDVDFVQNNEGYISNIELGQNGNFYVSGVISNTAQHGVRMYNQSGVLNNRYTGFVADLGIQAIAPLPNGELLVGGNFQTVNSQPHSYLVKLSSSGLPQLGKKAISNVNNHVQAIALQSDGKVLISGGFTEIKYKGDAPVASNGLARLTSSGEIDHDFKNDNAIAGGDISALALLADGDIVVGGSFNNMEGVTRLGMAKLKPNGMLDAGLAPFLPTLTNQFNARISDIVEAPDGSIFLAGDNTFHVGSGGEPKNTGLVKLNAQGDVDHSFDIGAGATFFVTALALQPDGKLLVAHAGRFLGVSLANKGVVRFNPDGSLDASFDTGLGVLGGQILGMKVLRNKKILLVGYFTGFNGVSAGGIVRLNADGSRDLSFNAGGTGLSLEPQSPGLAQGYNILEQSDGKVLISGKFQRYNGVAKGGLVRLNVNGSLDSTFMPGQGFAYLQGQVPTPPQVRALCQYFDGSIYVGGLFNRFNGSAITGDPLIGVRGVKLTANGALDSSFQVNTLDAYDCEVDAQQRLLIAGESSIASAGPGGGTQGIAQLDINGNLIEGAFVGAGIPNQRRISVLKIARNGKLLLGGDFESFNGNLTSGFTRLSTDSAATYFFLDIESINKMVTISGGSAAGANGTEHVTFAISDTGGSDWTPLQPAQFPPGLPPNWEVSRPSATILSGTKYIRVRTSDRGSILERVYQQYYKTDTKDEEFCVPIKTSNGKVAVICL